MRKIYSFLFLAAVAGISATAQQVPNGTFEGAYEPKAPWTSTGNTETKGFCSPESWTISNVIGVKFLGKWTGSTQVGEAVAGYNSDRAIKIYNAPNSTLPTQIVPGYLI